MASVGSLWLVSHLRAEPNQYILHHKKGRLVRHGPGLAYWFSNLSASLAEVPVEDMDTTFLLHERTDDFQEVTVQATVTYRLADPVRAAKRVNFTISLDKGTWLEEPLQRLNALLQQRAQRPTRSFLAQSSLAEALREGADRIQEAIDLALREDLDLADMGVAVVGVQVNKVSPTAELEKALQTPTRESLQQKADEAVFQRRALAVEKERAIKENELQSQIELARRTDDLIRQQGQNTMQEVQQAAAADKARVEAALERDALSAGAHAKNAVTRAEGEAEARRLQDAAAADGERMRVEVWEGAPAKVVLGLALQQLAGNIDHIQHLNLTPDLFAQGFSQLLQDQAGKA